MKKLVLLPDLCASDDCSTAVSNAYGGRRTMRMTAVERAADGRQTMNIKMVSV